MKAPVSRVSNFKMFISRLFLLVSICVLKGVPTAESSKILALHPAISHSHVILLQSILRELAVRGHEVTFVGNFRMARPVENLREIIHDNSKFMKSHKGVYCCVLKFHKI